MEMVQELLLLGVAKKDIILYLADTKRYWGNAVLKLSETGLHGQFGELVFDVESESDYNIVQEVYLDLEYGCCTGAEKLLVLDMGMNRSCQPLLRSKARGYSSIWLRAILPHL